MSYFSGAYKKRKGNHTFSSQSSVSTYDSSVLDNQDESRIKNFRYVMKCPKILSEKPTKLTRLFNEHLKYSYLYETFSVTAAATIISTAAGGSSYDVLGGFNTNVPFGSSTQLQTTHDLFMGSSPNLPSAIFDTSMRSCFIKSTTQTSHYFNAGNTSACFELSEVLCRQTTDLVLQTQLNDTTFQYAAADQGYNQGTYNVNVKAAVYPTIVAGSIQYYMNHNPAWKRHFKTLSTKKFIIGPGQSFKIIQHFPINSNISSNDLSDAFTCYKGWSFLVLRTQGQMTLGGAVGADAAPVHAAVNFSSYFKQCHVGTIINHAINNNSVAQYGEKAAIVTSGVGHHFDEDGDTVVGTGDNLNAVDNDPFV